MLVVRDGRIEAVGARDAVDIPPDAEQIDVTGRTIMPGLINAHGHVNPSPYTEDEVESQLALYARYGVTTVFSLGGDGPEGMAVRDRQDTSGLDRARLYVAGPVVTGDTPHPGWPLSGGMPGFGAINPPAFGSVSVRGFRAPPGLARFSHRVARRSA